MNKFIGCVVILLLNSVMCISQITEYNFVFSQGCEWEEGVCVPKELECNPFVEEKEYFFDEDRWRVTHGSPSVTSCKNLECKNAVLAAEWGSSNTARKSEGLYAEYDFEATHSYDIKVTVKSYTSGIGLQVYSMKNGINSSSFWCNSSNEPSIPSVSEQLISTYSLSSSPLIKNWIPSNSTDHNHIWIKSIAQENRNGEIQLSSVKITDNGTWDNTNPTVPSNLFTSKVTKTSFQLDWDPSTDNQGIKHYVVYLDNTVYATTSNTSINITGLSTCSNHNVFVRVYDNSDNYTSSATYFQQTLSDVMSTLTRNIDLTTDITPSLEASEEIRLLPGFRFNPVNSSYMFTAKIVDGGCPSFRSQNISKDNGSTVQTKETNLITIYDYANDKEYDDVDTYTSDVFTEYDDHIKLLPNPARDEINVECSYFEQVKYYQIVNVNGESLIQSELSGSNTIVDLERLVGGVYYFKLITEVGDIKVQRLIKL